VDTIFTWGKYHQHLELIHFITFCALSEAKGMEINMNDIILRELKAIEERENVKILYACESGSRAWGFPSKDSDYDVRFIYIRPLNWYLSILDKRDVIELPINDVLDISGWDIRKALKLFKKSNPPMLEWLKSQIVYLEQFTVADKIRELIPQVYSPQSCLYHYLSMAKGNFREYLQGDLVKAKKYFYVLRPVLACLWIKEKQVAPPTEFLKLVDAVLPEGELKNEINRLLVRKMAGDELDLEPRIQIINDFLNDRIVYLGEYIKTLAKTNPPEETILDELFREALQEVWG